MADGQTCASGTEILNGGTSKVNCKDAMDALGISGTTVYSTTSGSNPGGCFTRTSDGLRYYNTASASQSGVAGYRPICWKSSTEKCIQMPVGQACSEHASGAYGAITDATECGRANAWVGNPDSTASSTAGYGYGCAEYSNSVYVTTSTSDSWASSSAQVCKYVGTSAPTVVTAAPTTAPTQPPSPHSFCGNFEGKAAGTVCDPGTEVLRGSDQKNNCNEAMDYLGIGTAGAIPMSVTSSSGNPGGCYTDASGNRRCHLPAFSTVSVPLSCLLLLPTPPPPPPSRPI